MGCPKISDYMLGNPWMFKYLADCQPTAKWQSWNDTDNQQERRCELRGMFSSGVWRRLVARLLKYPSGQSLETPVAHPRRWCSRRRSEVQILPPRISPIILIGRSMKFITNPQKPNVRLWWKLEKIEFDLHSDMQLTQISAIPCQVRKLPVSVVILIQIWLITVNSSPESDKSRVGRWRQDNTVGSRSALIFGVKKEVPPRGAVVVGWLAT